MVDLPSLIEQLGSNDLERQRVAAESLAQLGEEASPAAVALLQACEVEDEALCEWVVASLEQLGPPPAEDLPRICRQLAADHELSAFWSASLLGRLHQEAAGAVDSLGQAVEKSAHPAVRQRAAWALGQIGPAAQGAKRQLQEASVCSDPRTARLAQEALQAIER
jgi:HEAT repeat protein